MQGFQEELNKEVGQAEEEKEVTSDKGTGL